MRIDGYRPGRFTIGGVEYAEDVIILRGAVRAPWVRKAGREVIAPEDLGAVIGNAPAVVCLGVGHLGLVTVRSSTVEALVTSGCQVVIDRTRGAVDAYNRLLRDGVDVAAALLVS